MSGWPNRYAPRPLSVSTTVHHPRTVAAHSHGGAAMGVRLPDPRQQGWWRRRLPALALAWAVVAALSVLPLGFGPATEARAESGVTVEGPEVWQPATGTYGEKG